MVNPVQAKVQKIPAGSGSGLQKAPTESEAGANPSSFLTKKESSSSKESASGGQGSSSSAAGDSVAGDSQKKIANTTSTASTTASGSRSGSGSSGSASSSSGSNSRSAATAVPAKATNANGYPSSLSDPGLNLLRGVSQLFRYSGLKFAENFNGNTPIRELAGKCVLVIEDSDYHARWKHVFAQSPARNQRGTSSSTVTPKSSVGKPGFSTAKNPERRLVVNSSHNGPLTASQNSNYRHPCVPPLPIALPKSAAGLSDICQTWCSSSLDEAKLFLLGRFCSS